MTITKLESLVNGCRQQDRRSQELIYQHFSRSMFAICRRYAKNTAEAEDILQEAFIKIFTRIDQYTGKGSFEGWMKRVMVNSSISAYRKNKSSVATTDIDSVEYKQPATTYNATEDKDFMAAVLNQLPAMYRVPFNLVAIEGYSHQETSKMTGITEEQSRVHVFRARAMLKKALIRLQPQASSLSLSA